LNPPLKAALFFLPVRDIVDIIPFGAGNINDTFSVTLHSGEQRILQRLNPEVFPDPVPIMENIRIVLDHFEKQMQKEGAGEDNFIPLMLYEGKTGSWYQDEDGAVWRLMNMIKDCRTCQNVSDLNQARELGKGLGFFHRILNTFDPEKLADPLPDFHNTPEYLRRFDTINSSLEKPKTPGADFCYRFIDQKRPLVDLLDEGKEKLQHGVIHGDPKVSNFLFNLNRERVISLIDLDTVKPGLLLHDLGDGLRSCCNPAGETPKEEDKVFFDPELFQGWLQGYFSTASSLLTENDWERIVDYAQLITFELGLRFFTDYLEGNRYFKIRFADQNLYRARIQFSLVKSIEKQRDILESIVNNLTTNTNRINHG
jgi:hypothetical protein